MPLTSAETVRRGRLGPGQLLLVDQAAAKCSKDAEARGLDPAQPADPRRPAPDARRPSPEAPSTIRRSDRPSSATSPVSTPNVPVSTSRPWPSRRTSPCGAWATTRRRPVGRGSTARWPITFARPLPRSRTRPIDPERERIVMDLRVELGRRLLLGSPPRLPLPPASPARPGRSRRPVCLALDGGRASSRLAGPEARRRRIRRGSDGWPALDGIAAEGSRSRPQRGARSPCPHRPMVLRRGASAQSPLHPCRRRGPHRATAGLRGRTDLVVNAPTCSTSTPMAMALAVGARRFTLGSRSSGGRAGGHAWRRKGHPSGAVANL